MIKTPLNLLLADDDKDDCIFFKEALEELSVFATLTTVNDGSQLMKLLSIEKEALPDVIFLDLNMPGKNGIECLVEIKLDKDLELLPVIILSTSFDKKVVDLLYEKGANHYIRKPTDFDKLKKVIHQALTLLPLNKGGKENFVISYS